MKSNNLLLDGQVGGGEEVEAAGRTRRIGRSRRQSEGPVFASTHARTPPNTRFLLHATPPLHPSRQGRLLLGDFGLARYLPAEPPPPVPDQDPSLAGAGAGRPGEAAGHAGGGLGREPGSSWALPAMTHQAGLGGG